MQGSSQSSDLLGFVASLNGDARRVEESLGEGYVRLRVSEAERRQAKHDIRCIEDVVIELLRNARDAGAKRIFVASSREEARRTLVVLDDGRGIPPDMWRRVFDARVTSKLDSIIVDRWGVHGRGMALFSIRENVESAQIADSGVGLGTSIRIVSDANRLAERADQSTWPEVHGAAQQITIGKGPHNIVRVCCEFALEQEGVNVYVGSPAEVLATIRQRIPSNDPSLRGSGERPSVLGPIAQAATARQLVVAAAKAGIEVSERTAQRVVSCEIRPLVNTRTRLLRKGTRARGDAVSAGNAGPASLKLSQEDASHLAHTVQTCMDSIAERYYVHSAGEPVVRVRGNTVHITIRLAPDDEA